MPVIFTYMAEFEGPRTIEGQHFYGSRGRIVDMSDLAGDASLYQSFAHLNHRGAMIASDRVAAAVEQTLRPGAARGTAAGAI